MVAEAAMQTVTATAVDDGGNSTNLSVTMNRDKTLPSLALAPSNGATVTNAQPAFFAHYSDSLGDVSAPLLQTLLNRTNLFARFVCFAAGALSFSEVLGP
jgi:hypothetical protein